MKLTIKQIQHTLDQIEAQDLPDDNPAVPQLIQIYGDHTFFVDSDGLHIVEPIDPGTEGAVVRLANWADPQRTTLAAHKPEMTDVIVDLDSDE